MASFQRYSTRHTAMIELSHTLKVGVSSIIPATTGVSLVGLRSVSIPVIVSDIMVAQIPRVEVRRHYP